MKSQSQPQNPEFRNNPENFHSYICESKNGLTVDQDKHFFSLKLSIISYQFEHNMFWVLIRTLSLRRFF